MEELLDRLNDYILVLNVLDGVRGDPLVEEKFKVVSNSLQQAQDGLETMAGTIARCKELSDTMQIQYQQLDALQERLRHLIENRRVSNSPSDCNGSLDLIPSNSGSVEHYTTPTTSHNIMRRSAAPNFHTLNRGPSPIEPLPHNGESSVFSSTIEVGATPKPRKDMDIAISYIGNTEFATIPSYMRGRVRLEEIVAFVDLFNSVLNKKYALIQKPKRLVKAKNEVDLLVEWKEQSNPELVDQYYITEKDFTSLNRHKLSQKDRNIITMLRHVQRLKEIKIKKISFYVARF